jgi:hypothetical protein
MRSHAQRFLRDLDENEARIQRLRSAPNADPNGPDRDDNQHDGTDGGSGRAVDTLALRPLAVGEIRVKGELMKIECAGARSVILIVKAGDKSFRLHSADLSAIRFSSFTTEIAGGQQITCGLFAQPPMVLATYRPAKTSAGRSDGEAVAIEFVPPDTVLP